MTKRQDAAQQELTRFEPWGLIHDFLTEYGEGSKTRNFYNDQVGRAFRNFLEAQGVEYLDEITPQMLREYLVREANSKFVLAGREKRLSPRSVVHRYESARRFLAWCAERRYIAENPMMWVKAPQAPEDVVVGFSREDARKLSTEASRGWDWLGKRDYAIVVTLLGTGARADELLTMTEEAIDWGRQGKAGRIALRGKGGKVRRVPMGEKVARALKAYIRAKPETRKTDAFWITFRGTALKYGALNMMLKNLGRYAGVEGVRPHRFRHTYASQWWEHHQDIMALKNLLGHSKVAMTEKYLRTLGYDYGTDERYETPDKWLA